MRDVIKVKPKVTIIIIFVITGLFGVMIYLSNQSAKKYEIADSRTEINTAKINGDEAYGSLRGTIFYAKKKGISSSAELIDNEYLDKRFWDSHGPIIDFDKNPHHYTIDDLKFPYILSKKANSDTLIVEKDSVKFFFKMIIIK